MKKAENNNYHHILRVQRNYKPHIRRLVNYKRVLIRLLIGDEIFGNIRSEVESELVITDTIITMLITICGMTYLEYAGKSHCELCRGEIGISSERLGNIISNGTRITNNELQKIMLFNIN